MFDFPIDGTVQDLLKHVTELEDAYQQEKLDHERESQFNRDIQLHEMELMDQISRIKNIMVSRAIFHCLLKMKFL